MIWIAGFTFLTAVVTAMVAVLALRSQTRTENILQLLAERDTTSREAQARFAARQVVRQAKDGANRLTYADTDDGVIINDVVRDWHELLAALPACDLRQQAGVLFDRLVTPFLPKGVPDATRAAYPAAVRDAHQRMLAEFVADAPRLIREAEPVIQRSFRFSDGHAGRRNSTL